MKLVLLALLLAPSRSDPAWPTLRRAVARYCDSLTVRGTSPDDSGSCGYGLAEEAEWCDSVRSIHAAWCDDARAQMAGPPDRSTWMHRDDARHLTLKLGDTCGGYWIKLTRTGRGWTVMWLTSSAEDPC